MTSTFSSIIVGIVNPSTKLGNNFIKINQSCLVNKHYIKCFRSSWKGSFLVELKNGEKDFISRRQTKIVLERMGLK